MLADMASELDEINRRVAALDVEVKHLAKSDTDLRRLVEIPWGVPDHRHGNGCRHRHRLELCQGA